MRVDLASPTDVRDFRVRANTLLAHQVPPAEIDWQPALDLSSGHKHLANDAALLPPSALHAIVPRSFVRLTELVVLHRNPARFELMYRLLWRLVHEPELAGSHDDAEMALAQSMAQSVRRDVLRCRKNLRMRTLPPKDDVTLMVGSCEPQHQVTELLAEWLARQHPMPPWLLASPDRCVLWTGRHLLCGPGLAATPAHAMADAQWHALAAELAAEPVACV
jgi:probable DNA metabolism protein